MPNRERRPAFSTFLYRFRNLLPMARDSARIARMKVGQAILRIIPMFHRNSTAWRQDLSADRISRLAELRIGNQRGGFGICCG